MICCAFVMKGAELGEQWQQQQQQQPAQRRRLDGWLDAKTNAASPLRRQLSITTQSINDLLSAAVEETKIAGQSLCKCQENLPAVGETSTGL